MINPIRLLVFLDLARSLQDMVEAMVNSDMALVLVGLAMLWVSSMLFTPKSGKISTGRFGGRTERWTARMTGNKQRKERKTHKVALKAGNVDIPHAQQSVIVAGSPDSGKTYSIIDPAIRSAIATELPILVYDFKGSQLETHIAWASSQGYQVAVFAPGQPYTSVCNPLDFLADATDSLMASQLAQVLQRNTQREGGYRENDFFATAGTNLVEAVMLLAKTTSHPDLLMASQILNLTHLPARIRAAATEKKISPWTLESFSQLLASETAEKQLAGIVATAQRTFKNFTGKQLISSFCGTTTIPLDLTGKTILFLQVDIQRRDAVSPLIAAVLHLIVTRNFSYTRKDPLVISLDELPTLYLPDLPKWINEFRSNGFVSLLGYQNFAQLQYIYGRDLSRALFAACGTKVFFNPKDRETASEFSSYLGEKEVRLQTRSQNYGSQSSRSRTEQYHRVSLLTTDQILKMNQGECVFINPAYAGGGESSVPLRLKVRLSKEEQWIQDRSTELWHTLARDRLISRVQETQKHEDLDMANAVRRDMAEKLFPLPQEVASAKADFGEDEYDDVMD
jgi:type IV secretion system protein VirD4